jgi:hypothetical protein
MSESAHSSDLQLLTNTASSCDRFTLIVCSSVRTGHGSATEPSWGHDVATSMPYAVVPIRFVINWEGRHDGLHTLIRSPLRGL